MTKLFCDWCSDECPALVYLSIERNPGLIQKHEVCEKCSVRFDEITKLFIKDEKERAWKEALEKSGVKP